MNLAFRAVVAVEASLPCEVHSKNKMISANGGIMSCNRDNCSAYGILCRLVRLRVLGRQDHLVVALARGISVARYVGSKVGTKMAAQETFGWVQLRACLSVFSNMMVVFGYLVAAARLRQLKSGELVIDSGRRENLLPQ